MKLKLINQIKSRKEYSGLLDEDISRVAGKGEDVKVVRKKLHEIYTAVLTSKLLNPGIVEKKSVDEILKKHISTKERFGSYCELYKRILGNFKEKVSIIDLGAGINGLSYNHFKKYCKNYLAVEAVGQLVDIMNLYFKKNNIKNAEATHESLFNMSKIKKMINSHESLRVVFLFKVLDSLEMVERNYSKKLLLKLIEDVDMVIVSFARASISGKRFQVKRYWFENFIKEMRWEIRDDFVLGSERYIVFKK